MKKLTKEQEAEIDDLLTAILDKVEEYGVPMLFVAGYGDATRLCASGAMYDVARALANCMRQDPDARTLVCVAKNICSLHDEAEVQSKTESPTLN